MANSVIIKPIITEKVTSQSETLNRYGFIVADKANKNQIKKAVEDLYGVKVERVNTMNYGGGKPNLKWTTKGVAYERNKNFKKAIVTIADGDIIDLYSDI